MLDALSIRESVIRKINTAEDNIDNLLAMITVTSSFDPSVFHGFAGNLVQRSDYVKAVACLSVPEIREQHKHAEMSVLGKYETSGFTIEDELEKLHKDELSHVTENIFASNRTTILSAGRDGQPGKYIWLS